MREKEYPIGVKNGNIEVIGERHTPHLRYKVRCNLCGNESLVSSSDLNTYMSYGGCPKCQKQFIDSKNAQRVLEHEVGRTYGYLKVLGYTGEKFTTNRSEPYVKVKCRKCGAVTEVPLDQIKSGKIKTCPECVERLQMSQKV